MNTTSKQPVLEGKHLADHLNQDCHCISLDRNRLQTHLQKDLQDKGLPRQMVDKTSHLFSEFPVFLWEGHVENMQALIQAVDQVVKNPNYQQEILGRHSDLTPANSGASGVFFGFDFHLGEEGPQLIEINTNAGGVLLNHYLAAAQQACCDEVEAIFPGKERFEQVEKQIIQMFMEEHRALNPEQPLTSIAIVDQSPESQFLYPELLLFKTLFERHGIKAFIVDPLELKVEEDALWVENTKIDLVYNRLTDFYFELPDHAALKTAFQNSLATITPSPWHYALYADKRNLVILSDEKKLKDLGIDDPACKVLLATIPTSVPLTEHHWSARKQLFFKPVQGYGSKGTYRGAKITRKVFSEIQQSPYIAQTLIPPSERQLIVNDEKISLKLDIRCVTYQGDIQQLSSRLYRGQTTNLRTEGGGLATVFASPEVQPELCQ